MKSSGLTTLICLTSARNALGAAVLLNHLKYTALPHTSPSCHSVITRRGALNRSTLPVSRVSLPSHTSQLAVDPLFLSGSEYGWMTGLLKKPRLTLTNLAVFPFFFYLFTLSSFWPILPWMYFSRFSHSPLVTRVFLSSCGLSVKNVPACHIFTVPCLVIQKPLDRVRTEVNLWHSVTISKHWWHSLKKQCRWKSLSLQMWFSGNPRQDVLTQCTLSDCGCGMKSPWH